MGLFSTVRGYKPRRSVFNLSYDKKFTCDMGQLIPVMCDEVVPGDVWKISNECVIRFQPLVAPVLHEINVFTHYFFVPYRLLWSNWEAYITGGKNGDDTHSLPTAFTTTGFNVGTFEDYIGFPTGVIFSASNTVCPVSFPSWSYRFIYDSYYRDENLQNQQITLPSSTSTAVDFTTGTPIYNRAWKKDYFTSALPWQQRGTSPALPITGTGQAVFDLVPESGYATLGQLGYVVNNPSGGVNAVTGHMTNGSNAVTLVSGNNADTTQDQDLYIYPTTGTNTLLSENNSVDLSDASTFDIADLRLAFQTQKWMERNARCGVRYTEFLRAHFGVAPRDDRLDRPEYIGGTKSPVIISEVLQTSETTASSPQANLAGRGITADGNFVTSYHVQEYGLIMGLMSVMPKPAYSQGLNRQWCKESRFDWFFPEFVSLSEQAIRNQELYLQNSTDNKDIFGYQGRYDEMRYKPNMVCSEMRSTFDYWHLSREFDSLPSLNSDFIQCKPSTTKRIFAVQSVPGLIVDYANKITAIRPLPRSAEPGYIDHH